MKMSPSLRRMSRPGPCGARARKPTMLEMRYADHAWQSVKLMAGLQVLPLDPACLSVMSVSMTSSCARQICCC